MFNNDVSIRSLINMAQRVVTFHYEAVRIIARTYQRGAQTEQIADGIPERRVHVARPASARSSQHH